MLSTLQGRVPAPAELRAAPAKYVVAVVAVVFGFVALIQPAFFFFDDNLEYTVWLWTISLGVYWLKNAREDDRDWVRYLSVALATVAVACGLYMILNFRAFRITRVGVYNDVDLVVGTVIIVITIVSAYAEYGLVLTTVAVGALVYGIFGQYLLGIFEHAGLGERVITVNSVEFSGVFGIVTQAAARWVYIFLIYAGIMKTMGALDLFIQLGIRAGRYVSSGVSQIAVISSLIIGSISGSAPANTALTGSFTIPMMKRRGIKKETAAAIESVASSGGQIMPPVMGIVAFIMADLLAVSYTDIIIMAFVPGVMFYLMVVFSVHLISDRMERRGDAQLDVTDLDENSITDDEGNTITVMPTRELLIEVTPVTISFGLLVAVLVISRINPARAAFWTILALIGVNAVKNLLTREEGVSAVRSLANEIDTFGDGLYQGTITMAPITIIVAALNIIITIFNVTGFGNRISLQLVGLADVSFFLFLGVLTVVIIFLGMGMPTIAAYLITVAVAVPALVQFGFPEPVAHFFVLYVAVFSNVTPPVAFTCAVACNIAESDFVATCVDAMKVGVAMIVLPFLILYNPKLIEFVFPDTLGVIFLSFVGLGFLVVFLQDWSPRGELSRIGRVGSLAASFGLFWLSYALF